MKARKLMVGFLISVVYVCCFISLSHAEETTVIVNLQKKIRENFSEMKRMTKEKEGTINSIKKEMEPLVNQIEHTEDERKRDALTYKYYELRAKEIYEIVGWGKDAAKSIERICSDMSALRGEMKRVGQRENEKLDATDSTAVRQTLKGLANVVAPLYALNRENPRMQYLAMTLQTLDSQYKRFFTNDGHASLDEQIAYMEDLHAYTRSVMTTLDMERVYLQQLIFVMMSDGIIKVINDMSADFYKSTVLAPALNERHLLDSRVSGQRPAMKAFADKEFDTGQIGNW